MIISCELESPTFKEIFELVTSVCVAIFLCGHFDVNCAKEWQVLHVSTIDQCEVFEDLLVLFFVLFLFFWGERFGCKIQDITTSQGIT